MRILTMTAAAIVALTAASAASAAPMITSVAVTGNTTNPQTVWNTARDSFYTVFVSRPYGNTLNPNDNFTGASVTDPVKGRFDYTLAGDGYPVAAQPGVDAFPNSDLSYTLTINLADGNRTGVLTGTYTEATRLFTATSGSFMDGGTTYSLTRFNWVRGQSNIVGVNSSINTDYDEDTRPGSGYDYQGAFTLRATTSAVPEPATWAMMIVGFGLVGGAMRSRRTRKPLAALA